MILSTNTSFLARKFGHKKAIEMIADAGFDAYDMSFFDNQNVGENPFYSEGYLEYAKELRAYADKIGIKCNQAHAPFGSSFGDPEKDAERFDLIVRAMECASILGAGDIVVHPCQHLTYSEKGNPEILKDINIDFYRRLLPFAEKYNIRVACENMWQHDSRFDKIVHSTCTSPDEFVDYVDSIGSPYLIACLDVGHAALVDEKIEDIICALGHDRLKALHVHDVDGHSDLHTLPYLSKIDWDAVLSALKDIDYDGDFTFEASSFLIRMPDELLPAGLRFMCETGRVMIDKIEK